MIDHSTSRPRRLGLPGLSHPHRLAADLGGRLDDGFHWFRTVPVGGPEPIDAVLVGPGGTWCLTLDGERGRFERRNGHWYSWNRATGSWVPWDAVPVTTARLAGHRLSLLLERAGLPATVGAVLAPDTPMEVDAPPGESLGISVERDPGRLATLVSAEDRLSRAQVDRIVALLDPRERVPRLAQAARGG